MIFPYLLTICLSIKWISANKENNPKFCRCGEARKGEKVMPVDIQDAIKDKTSTTKEPPPPGDYSESQVLTVKALDNNNIMVSSGSDKISLGILSRDEMGLRAQKTSQSVLADDELGIREKYAPYDPQMRPWLVIIEVNMTDPELNTECTGNMMARRVSLTSDRPPVVRSSAVPVVGHIQQILRLWRQVITSSM